MPTSRSRRTNLCAAVVDGSAGADDLHLVAARLSGEPGEAPSVGPPSAGRGHQEPQLGGDGLSALGSRIRLERAAAQRGRSRQKQRQPE